jgi:cell division FtsZ-interacting protein ZapD
MDEINEQTENMKQIQELLSAPIGAAADFDEVISNNNFYFHSAMEIYLLIDLSLSVYLYLLCEIFGQHSEFVCHSG